MTRVLALMQLRNEEKYLEGCLRHLAPYVDGIVALDDGSTDATPRILAAEPAVIATITRPVVPNHVWREGEYRRLLMEKGVALGADWFVGVDADERFELRFLRELRNVMKEAEERGNGAIGIKLRELFDSPRHYRVDGIWNRKRQLRCFRPPTPDQLPPDDSLHQPWVVRKDYRLEVHWTKYNLYHLKMVYQADRTARRDRYEALDPNGERQAAGVGYAYLTDEAGTELRAIGEVDAYDYDTVPSPTREHRGEHVLRLTAP